MSNYRFKIKGIPDTSKYERADETVKALKAITEYSGPDFQVIGLPFGGPISGRDAEGEAFHAKTDIGMVVGDTRPVTYYHGFGPDDPYEWQEHPAFIGQAVYTGVGKMTTADGVEVEGFMFDVKLDESEPLAQRIINAENVKASSGAVGHLVRPGKAGMLDVWPVGELALLDVNEWRQPANDYAVVVQKSRPVEAELEPEAVAEAAEELPVKANAAEGEDEADTILIDELLEEFTMDENLKTEVSALVTESVKTAVAEAIKSLAGEPAPGGGLYTGAPAIKRITDRGFEQDELKSFFHWIKTGDEVPYKAAMAGQVDASGGFAIPDDFLTRIIEKRNEISVIRRMGIVSIPTSLDRVLVPIEDTAATKFVVTAEAGSYDENEPTLGQKPITVHKLTKLIKLSEEVEKDASVSGFDAYLSGLWGRALAAAENYYLVASGTGTGMPQAALQGATDCGTTPASATAVTVAEMLAFIYAMPEPYVDNLAMVMKRSTLAKLRGLTTVAFAFMATPQGEGGAMTNGSQLDGYVHGIPVYCTDAMPASTALLKAFLLFNPDFYAVVEHSGMTISRNPYLYQATGQIGLFANYRQGGGVLQSEAVLSMSMHS